MRKKLCVFLLLTVGCLLGRPNYVEAEENVQQENVIEPSALQSLPAPEPDPEWKENEQNEQAQSFSQKKIYAEVEERIKQALLTGETQVSVVDLQIPVEANLNSLLFYSPTISIVIVILYLFYRLDYAILRYCGLVSFSYHLMV